MSRFYKIYCAALFLVFLISGNAYAKSAAPITQRLWNGISENEIEALKKISVALQHSNYDEALKYAEHLKTSQNEDKKIANQNNSEETPEAKPDKLGGDFYDAVVNIILWNKYSGKVSGRNIYFNDISRFVTDNAFYPNMSELKRNVEKVAVINNIPYKSSEQYFKSNPASTTESKIYLLSSKIDYLLRFTGSDSSRADLQAEIKKLASTIWVDENFSPEEEKSFLTKYQNQLNQIDHINRVDRLLWDGKIADAKRIMGFVNEDYNKLFNAVIELQGSPKYIDSIVLSVPRKLRANEGLSYRRILWYKSHDKLDDLLETMVDLPDKLQFPERWWSLRRLYTREMIKRKKYKLAYAISSKHSLPTKSSDFWEAEWTTGWIALRFLDEPKIAYKHFENLYNNVQQPVTLSRATYWLGMAAEEMGNKQKAIEWYKMSTKYPIYFYGQLGIHKHRLLDSVNAQADIILPKDPDITWRDMQNIAESRAAKVAYLLAITGDKKNALKIFEHIVNGAATDGQIAVIMKIINEFHDRQMDAKISRVAAKRNVFFIKDKFQIVQEVSSDEYAPLVHAIIKQESGFAPMALSNVGAVGFMQLMPQTAKLVCKDIGIKYDKGKLATDIKYNVRLGTHYIKTLINRFDGSEILAIASYNAGPNSAQRWINEFYDPRKVKDIDKVVDWIELITYSETRNYVQRIMENMIVYKYLMSRSNYDAIN